MRIIHRTLCMFNICSTIELAPSSPSYPVCPFKERVEPFYFNPSRYDIVKIGGKWLKVQLKGRADCPLLRVGAGLLERGREAQISL